MIPHELDPRIHIREQVRDLGIPEPLRYEQAVLYRFFDAAQRLLYVGVTRRPFERWQSHRRGAAWWPNVSTLTFEFHPHERAALDAEVAAIKSEVPLHNKRSAHAPLIDSSCGVHEESVSFACAALPRVGGGVGVRDRGGSLVPHSSYLTAANDGLWITHRPATQSPMQKSDDGGVR